jgi:hypothetical protein
MSAERPRFNSAVLKIISALGGDLHTGKCRCPCHDDRTPSLQIKNGDKVPVIVHCFSTALGRNHDRQVIDKIREMGAWPNSKALADAPTTEKQARTNEERRAYARKIWRELSRSSGREFAPLLQDYLLPRKIESVPPTALMTLPPMGYAMDDPSN